MGLNTAERRTLGRQVFTPKPENRKTIIRKPEAFSMRLLHIPILIIKKIVKIKINLYMKILKNTYSCWLFTLVLYFRERWQFMLSRNIQFNSNTALSWTLTNMSNCVDLLNTFNKKKKLKINLKHDDYVNLFFDKSRI